MALAETSFILVKTSSDTELLFTEDGNLDPDYIILNLEDSIGASGAQLRRRRRSDLRSFVLGLRNVGKTAIDENVSAAANNGTYLSRRFESPKNNSGTQLTPWQSVLFPSGTSVYADIVSSETYSNLIAGIQAGSRDLSTGSITDDLRVRIINSGGALVTGSVFFQFRGTPLGNRGTGWGAWTVL